tara:strand:+ start:311 stop:619 length:309 start_codon:yes stop_codon:yes gene_type:complete
MMSMLLALVLGNPVAASEHDHASKAVALVAVAGHQPNDNHHKHSEHCCEVLGTLGCSSTAQAITAACDWQPLWAPLTHRHAGDQSLLRSLAARPPERPPRLT